MKRTCRINLTKKMINKENLSSDLTDLANVFRLRKTKIRVIRVIR